MAAPEASIADRVREMRRLGMSGHDIAQEIGVGKSTVYRILKGVETQVSQCPKP